MWTTLPKGVQLLVALQTLVDSAFQPFSGLTARSVRTCRLDAQQLNVIGEIETISTGHYKHDYFQ